MVGNKFDSESREVETNQAEAFAKTNDLNFFEVSAKTGYNIQNLFRNIATKLQKKYNPNEYD
jgi:50S ribosomal subunit-associated GTPase HflX